jgi:hypothetical protein
MVNHDFKGWQAIAIGAVLTVMVFSFPLLAFLLSPLLIIVHELGHTSTNWIFGYPAIPALDFMFGGGVTLQSEERVPFIVGLAYAGFGYLFYRYWHHVAASRALLVGAIAYSLCMITPLQNILILAMGHGFELGFAGIFLDRALSGNACRNALEQPLYGLLGLYFVVSDIRLTWGLLSDLEMRDIYEQGKGGILDNDLVRIARDYLHSSLSLPVSILLIGTILVPVVVLWRNSLQNRTPIAKAVKAARSMSK